MAGELRVLIRRGFRPSLQTVLILTLLVCAPCARGQAPAAGATDSDIQDALKRLERQGPQSLPVAAAFGEDPCRIDCTADGCLVLLRNSSRILLTDSDLHVLDERAAPQQPAGWAFRQDEIFVVGLQSGEIGRYRRAKASLQILKPIPTQDAASLRDVAWSPAAGALFAVDAFDRRLLRIDPDRGQEKSWPVGAGPTRILALDDVLIVNLLYEHTLLILPLTDGVPDWPRAGRIQRRGPHWSLDAIRRGERLLIASGGIEDRDLDRTSGEFGWIDSFLYLDVLRRGGDGSFRRDEAASSSINLSRQGVVTPKAVRLSSQGLWVAGFGADRMLEFRWTQPDGLQSGGQGGEPWPARPRLNRVLTTVPGIADFAVREDSIVFASTLLDQVAELSWDSGRKRLWNRNPARIGAGSRDQDRRLGEALFFTTLLTPNNSSKGQLSRFSCEACHFEGVIDGRTHYTGRGHVFATTKPPIGLANNVPVFSRAGNPDLASMVSDEFHVANQGRKDDFGIDAADIPWLGDLGWVRAGKADLRRAFLTYFLDRCHPPNPWLARQGRLDQEARAGLEVFRDRCSHCHQPLTSTREDGQAIPFEQWESWLEDPDKDLVWGAPFLSKTGIHPYVDAAGARVPSLRRIWTKYPYFTDGSAKTIEKVLKDFRYHQFQAWHRVDSQEYPASLSADRLTVAQRRSLQALLRCF